MKSKRHVFLNLGLTHEETVELLDLVQEDDLLSEPLAKLIGNLRREFEGSDQSVMFSFEEESEQVLADREMCDEPGCENKATDDDEAPEGLCQPCRDTYEWVPLSVAGLRDYGWRKKEPVT